MSDFDLQRFADALNQNYVQFVPSWVARLDRAGRSVCSVDYRTAPRFFAVCNTTNIQVPFTATESPESVAQRLWMAVRPVRT